MTLEPPRVAPVTVASVRLRRVGFGNVWKVSAMRGFVWVSKARRGVEVLKDSSRVSFGPRSRRVIVAEGSEVQMRAARAQPAVPAPTIMKSGAGRAWERENRARRRRGMMGMMGESILRWGLVVELQAGDASF